MNSEQEDWSDRRRGAEGERAERPWADTWQGWAGGRGVVVWGGRRRGAGVRIGTSMNIFSKCEIVKMSEQ